MASKLLSLEAGMEGVAAPLLLSLEWVTVAVGSSEVLAAIVFATHGVIAQHFVSLCHLLKLW
jgi:hypothetical protein